jgi:hypothetical protein
VTWWRIGSRDLICDVFGVAGSTDVSGAFIVKV